MKGEMMIKFYVAFMAFVLSLAYQYTSIPSAKEMRDAGYSEVGAMGDGPDPSPMGACYPRAIAPATGASTAWSKTTALINDATDAQDFGVITVTGGWNGEPASFSDFAFNGVDDDSNLYAVYMTIEYVAQAPYQTGIGGIQILAHNEQGDIRTIESFDFMLFNDGPGLASATAYFFEGLTRAELNEQLTLSLTPITQASDSTFTANIRNIRLHLVAVD